MDEANTVVDFPGQESSGQSPSATEVTPELIDNELVEPADIRFGFKIDNIGLLIKKDIYSELIDLPEICMLPNTPPWITGMSNLRGSVYPVFDIHLLLNLHKAQNRKMKLLVLDKKEKMLGLLITEPPRSLKNLVLQQDKAPQNLPKILTRCISGIYTEAQATWLEFNHEVFFSSLSKDIGTD